MLTGLVGISQATPAPLSHGLVGWPLFSVDAVERLARALPADNVHRAPLSDPSQQLVPPRRQLNVEPDASLLDGHWLNLQNVELVDAYRELLVECLNDLTSHLSWARGRTGAASFVFAARGQTSAVPHLDGENNFLLQVVGSKRVWTWTPDLDDAEAAYDTIRAGRIGGLPGIAPDAMAWDLVPGTGVYIPPGVGHAVDYPEDELSISFSVAFTTRASARRTRQPLTAAWRSRVRELITDRQSPRPT